MYVVRGKGMFFSRVCYFVHKEGPYPRMHFERREGGPPASRGKDQVGRSLGYLIDFIPRRKSGKMMWNFQCF